MAERLLDSVQTQMGMDAGLRSAAADAPFRVLFLGDFSARKHRDVMDGKRFSQVRPQPRDYY